MSEGTVMSMGSEIVYFRVSDTSAVQKILKTQLLMIEDYKGTRHIFGANATPVRNKHTGVSEGPRNMLGIQPIEIFFGRFTAVYERLSADQKVGLSIPFSLTFDPFGSLYPIPVDTNLGPFQRIRGVKFITGADLNFYIGKSDRAKFFAGPRVRYGTDVFLRDIEGYSVQTQFGWKLGRPTGKIVQHVSAGYGIARILSAQGGTRINPKQSYSWFSVNYRLSFKW